MRLRAHSRPQLSLVVVCVASMPVHEKSILLPLLPAALLGVDYPVFAGWFGAVATFRCGSHTPCRAQLPVYV